MKHYKHMINPKKLFLSLLFAWVLFCIFSVRGMCQGENPCRNTSGNINYTPAVDPIKDSEGYSSILYDIRSGLPTSEVNAVAQTSDGFIWIGTYSGLIRYDGNTFEHPDITSSISNVRCLFIDQSNRLWIGTNDSGVFMLEGDSLQKWDRSDNLTSLSIRSITEDNNGNIYIANTDGIGIIDSSLTFHRVEDDRLLGHTVIELRTGTNELVYGITVTGDVYVIRNNSLIFILYCNSNPFGEVLSLLPDPNDPDLIYLGTEHHLIHGILSDLSSWENTDVTPLTGIESLEYIDGKIWICSRTGLGRIDDQKVSLVKDIPIDNSFYQIMTDQDGNIWAVSARQGIVKIVPNRFNDLFGRYDIDPEVVNSTCMMDNSLYIGTEYGLKVIKDGAVVNSLPIKSARTASGSNVEASDLIEFLDGCRIRSIIRDSTGALWISAGRAPSLIKYSNGTLIQFSPRDGLVSDAIRVVSECSDGSFLVATNDGINVINRDQVIKGYGQSAGLKVRLILTITEGFKHEIIAGSDGDGIYVINNGDIRQIGLDDGLTSEIVLRIRKSTKRGLYWIITSNSVAYMTPDYKVTTVHNFPFANNYDIIESPEGDLWILGSSGIYVITAEDILNDSSVEPVFFGISNGLPFVTTSNSYNELTETGELYISGTEGVIKIDTKTPAMTTSGFHTLLSYINADGKHISPDINGNFTIPGTTRKLTLHPHVINYSLADPDVYYRLEGFDLSDTHVKSSELGYLTYTNLQDGNYKFSMTITNRLDNTEQSVSYNIVKGRPLTFQAAASILLDAISLFIIFGLTHYAALRGIRRRPDDRIFYITIAVDIVLAVSDSASYLVEGLKFANIRLVLILLNTLVYISFALLPFLLFLYLYLRRGNYSSFPKKKIALFGIPCFLYIFIVITNIWTGLIFYIGESNEWKSGKMDQLVFVPVLLYFALSFGISFRINRGLVLIGAVIIAFHIISDILFQSIGFTSFMYTLFLICGHVSAMEVSLSEEAL